MGTVDKNDTLAEHQQEKEAWLHCGDVLVSRHNTAGKSRAGRAGRAKQGGSEEDDSAVIQQQRDGSGRDVNANRCIPKGQRSGRVALYCKTSATLQDMSIQNAKD